MEIRKPAYFDTFRCIAHRCPDSCCKEWEVEVDDTSAAFYRNLQGPLGDHLRSVLKDDPEWGTVMTIQDGRCPMWRQDGLCRIQAELGHDALCKTCRDFPRLCHDYGTFREYGLELSCPEAARLILSETEEPYINEECPGGDTPEYDEEAMAVLEHTRRIARSILQTPSYTIPQSLALLLYYGYHAQGLLDGQEVAEFSPEAHLDAMEKFAISGGEAALIEFFADLEILTPQWKMRLAQPLSPTLWTKEFRRLAKYFVGRYWLQAVSDYDLISRVKLTVISCILVHLLGGDPVQTAQLYSKEIENSAENVEAILDATYTHAALTDQKLLGMLL